MEVLKGVQFRPRTLNPIKWSVFRDGKARKLIKGVDYMDTTSSETLRCMAHQAAKRAGFICRTKSTDDGMIVQWFKDERE